MSEVLSSGETLSYEFDASLDRSLFTQYERPNSQPVAENVSTFMTSRVHDLTMSNPGVMTSTQKEPTQDSSDSSNTELCPKDFSQENSFQSSSSESKNPSFNTSPEAVNKLAALRNILIKFMAIRDRKSVFEKIGRVEEVEGLFSWFINFMASTPESGYYGDESSLSPMDMSSQSQNATPVAKKKVYRKQRLVSKTSSLAPVPEESFYSSGGDSLESGNLVYAPWDDDYYYPAEIQRTRSDSLMTQQLCTVIFDEPIGTTETPVDETSNVQDVHYQRIYNHEKLPVGSKVLALSDEQTYECAFIRQVVCPSRNKKFDYAYLVEFENSKECKPMKRKHVIIEPVSLKSVIDDNCVPPVPACLTSPSDRLVESLYRKLSISTPGSSANKYGDKDRQARDLFLSKRTARSNSEPPTPLFPPKIKADLKRTTTETTLSSTEVILPAKRAQKVFSGVNFVLTGFDNETVNSGGIVGPRTRSESILFINQPSCEEYSADSSTDSETEDQLVHLIETNGGKVIHEIAIMDKKFAIGEKLFLLAPRYTPTAKYLSALALDVPCLNGSRFVNDCIGKGSLYKYEDYRLPSGWDGENVLEPCRGQVLIPRRNLFQNVTFFLPLSLKNSPLVQMLECTRANVLVKERLTPRYNKDNTGRSFAVVFSSCQFSIEAKKNFSHYNIPVVDVAFIVQSLAHGYEQPLFDFLDKEHTDESFML